MKRREETTVRAGVKLNHSLRLEDISVAALEAKVLDDAEGPTLTFALSLQDLHWDAVDGHIVALCPVEVLIQDSAGDKPKNLALLRAAVRIVYAVTEELDEQKFACVPDFLGVVAWMQGWPYIRSEIQQLSTKLGFPPLTLPILLTGQTAKIPVVHVGTTPPLPPVPFRE